MRGILAAKYRPCFAYIAASATSAARREPILYCVQLIQCLPLDHHLLHSISSHRRSRFCNSNRLVCSRKQRGGLAADRRGRPHRRILAHPSFHPTLPLFKLDRSAYPAAASSTAERHYQDGRRSDDSQCHPGVSNPAPIQYKRATTATHRQRNVASPFPTTRRSCRHLCATHQLDPS